MSLPGSQYNWINRCLAACVFPALPAVQAQFDAAVERLSGPAARALLVHRPGAPPAIDAGKGPVVAASVAASLHAQALQHLWLPCCNHPRCSHTCC